MEFRIECPKCGCTDLKFKHSDEDDCGFPYEIYMCQGCGIRFTVSYYSEDEEEDDGFPDCYTEDMIVEELEEDERE